jgi:hypothetical protein
LPQVLLVVSIGRITCGYRKSYPDWRRAAMGYHRFGMLALLKLLGGLLVGTFDLSTPDEFATKSN